MTKPIFVDQIEANISAENTAGWDAVVLVSPKDGLGAQTTLHTAISAARTLDAQVGERVLLLSAPNLAGGRLVFSPTGDLNRDQDDVRCLARAAQLGLSRAVAAGAKQPLIVLCGLPNADAYAHAAEVALLGALGGRWRPLEARERNETEGLKGVGFAVDGLKKDAAASVRVIEAVTAVEEGRFAARDVCGTEPERMSPAKMAEYAETLFKGGPVQLEVLDSRRDIETGYPLMAAVARASYVVPRHQPRIIRLSYHPTGPVERTLLLAGKGVVYDTGGADIKAGGHMAGMSRDKGGAAAVIGFMKTVEKLAPKNLKVIAEIGAVRNSVGPDSFVSDEIIKSHAGVHVRIGNTDAEGRLVLADLLSHLRAKATEEKSPHLFSIATLTGHSVRAVGPYTIAMDNGPARRLKTSVTLETLGDLWGEPVEVSRLRPEDWAFVQPKSSADDVLSCNNAPSSTTARGHQFPMAFLAIASGLDRHGMDSPKPLPFTHIDIGGSAAEGSDWQHGRPTGAPVVALSAAYLL